ncbi:hypothetical protein G7Z17_g3132 [Cylindrodendrum hubeiense]|uniref:Uncharacterized protein n=1 Tax=Cylindrodendrum hubeiense TaxID=595255 RepID=A0A9P5HF95_9HYPO|nr:hypothetical protein G7Z17_g3132 [Cylindrodendrum hubeiense]
MVLELSPRLSQKEMEEVLGYTVDPMAFANLPTLYFYSDLLPVFVNKRRQTTREYEAWKEAGRVQNQGGHTIECGNDKIVITQRRALGFYKFCVELKLGLDFSLPLLFTEAETLRTIAAAKLRTSTARSSTSLLLDLPFELRKFIYDHALPPRKAQITGFAPAGPCNVPFSVGDLTGFYLPWTRHRTVLALNRQIRQEALPLAFERTAFRLIDIDDVVKFLITIGSIGRDNIRSLEFPWERMGDMVFGCEEFPNGLQGLLKLPDLHAVRCVQLLKQCKNLAFLRIHFNKDILKHMSKKDFRNDPGIKTLRTLSGLQKFEAVGDNDESLEHDRHVRWLRWGISPQVGRDGLKQDVEDISGNKHHLFLESSQQQD